jgi:hypothetical protein
MAVLEVRLLDELGVEFDGTAVALPNSRRACALLAWLALRPGPRSWPLCRRTSRRWEAPMPEFEDRARCDAPPEDVATSITVHVEIPEAEASRLAAQRDVFSQSLSRLAALAAEEAR